MQILRERKRLAKKEQEIIARDTAQLGQNIMPNAPEIEKLVLGSILIDTSVLPMVIGIFGKINPFYTEIHSIIYDCIYKMYNNAEQIDRLSVSEYLYMEGAITTKKLADYGYSPYLLIQMTEMVSNTANIETHCRILQQKYVCRDLISLCYKTINLAYNNEMFDAIHEITSYQIGFTQAKKIQFEQESMPKEFCSLFPRNRSSIVFSPAKSGKSAVIYSIFDMLSSTKIIDGQLTDEPNSFYFPNEMERPAKVLLFDGEMEDKDYQQRGWLESNIKRIKNTNDSIENIKSEVLLHKPDFVIIDTISQYCENLLDIKQVKKFFNIVKDIKNYCGVIIIAHTPKSEFGKKLSAASLFGSVAQANMIENLVSVNRINGKVYLKQHLSRSKPAFQTENDVLLLAQEEHFVNEKAIFKYRPDKIIDERILFYDIIEYKKVSELWNRGNFDCKHSFCRNYGIKTIHELNEILDIAKIKIEDTNEIFDFE